MLTERKVSCMYNLMVLSIFIFLYSISSKWLESTPINRAVLITVFGLTLALVLFTDAANANLG